jgi:hypothetical protein
VGDIGGCDGRTGREEIILLGLVACLVAVVLPDAVGPAIASIDTDVLLAAARSEVEASILTSRHLSALATIIPAAPVKPVV